jgi:hypothetical protein
MSTRHEVTTRPSERIQALFALIGLVILALIARIPST